MERIIECVPNFSEGRNMEIINSIVGTIEASGGVKVLDVDPGEATNRTVVFLLYDYGFSRLIAVYIARVQRAAHGKAGT